MPAKSRFIRSYTGDRVPSSTVRSAPVSELPPVHRIIEWKEIVKNISVVRAASRQRKKIRNMVVYQRRCDGYNQLYLINPIVLDDEGFRQLDALGHVSALICLAGDRDVDRTLLARYPNVVRWAPDREGFVGDDRKPSRIPTHHTIITEDSSFLDKRCKFFVFRNTAQPEAAMLLDLYPEQHSRNYMRYSDNSILITAESLQSRSGNLSVTTTMAIPSRWRKNMTSKRQTNGWWRKNTDGEQLRDEFERLLKLEFSQHIGAVGAITERWAKEQAVMAVERAFYKQF